MSGRIWAPSSSSAAAPARAARHRLAACLLLGGLLAALAFAPAHAEPAACPDGYAGKGRVAAIGPAGDLALADGAVLRLAGLSAAGAETELRAALDEIVGRDVAIAAGPKDRYGRLPGLVRLDGSTETVQAALLARGLAVARPEHGFLGCMAALLAAERPAREARRGVWARLPLDARNVAAIRAREGRFTIVAGRVLSVGNTRTLGYLNFGPVWRQDMTGRLPPSTRVALEACGMDPAGLAGKRVALRGTVTESGGPAIELRFAEQIDGQIDGQADGNEDKRRTGVE
ncbi:nuclease (SNase domain protein) [Ancylobacter novellus DSM 506]|uniref:Nuclease (SNase domain protein) n=1 Tax=Ancylobacter novellus (strain ATCC 8093 / DSM 506 / JCM 20403 / CCM 1077 / IAM 12100 / NBRC 12443 / NCIMB 10456) TaxID=639283 RepID=D7AAU6_ANCN5|nr:thermonuclease family protein [Ancylobacter novellus]ADH90963.1 nuclease (SNase domain protein) [Ancylobacter novellus DSM 506]